MTPGKVSLYPSDGVNSKGSLVLDYE